MASTTDASTAAPADRLTALDGLRGWASLSVIFFHLTWETFGARFPVFRSFPFAFLGNGNFAVALFLMVSGYVLTIRGWRSDDKAGVRRSIVKRYVRLTPPILASVLIFYAAVALGWSSAQVAGQIVQRPDWLQAFGSFHPDVVDALSFGSFGVYFGGGPQSYGPFLWTMTIELWGSFLVLLLCWFELPARWSYLPLALLVTMGIFLTFVPYFPVAACYPAGAMVALAVKDGLVASGPPRPLQSTLASLVVVASLLAVAWAETTGISTRYTAILAMAAFVAVLRSGPALRLLSAPLSRWLGQVSFPLYLVQISVIVTITSGLIAWADRNGVLDVWEAGAIAVVSIGCCLLAAALFMPVERFALWLSARVGEAAVRRRLSPS